MLSSSEYWYFLGMKFDFLSIILLIAVGAGAFFWWRSKRNPKAGREVVVKIDHGFSMTTTPDGSCTSFAINGSGIGGGAWSAFIFFGLLFGFVALLAFNSLNALYLVMAVATGLAFLWDRHRKKRFFFEVTNDDVKTSNGQRYAKNDISELLIRNGDAVAQSSSTSNTTVVAGTGVMGVAMVGASVVGNAAEGIGKATGQSLAKSLAKHGNQLCIRHGRKVIPLAKHLLEDDAIALFNKVKERF